MSATRYYGRVTAAASERVMLESLGVEVAPLRAEDAESFYVRMDDTARARLAELATDFPHVLHRRSPDLIGPLSVLTLGPAERAAEVAFLDYREGLGGQPPAWMGMQREALAHKGVSWRPGLSDAQVAEVLAAQEEGTNPSKIGRYVTLDALAEKVRSSRHWDQGEIFTCALDDARFVVMKQVAPASCEMLTLTHHGYHDVLTAYRYDQQELVEQLRGYLQVAPEPALRYAQAPGFAIGGFVVGNRAKMQGNANEATIVGLRTEHGQTRVTLQFGEPQPVDAPEGATGQFFDLDWRNITATWAPGPVAATGSVSESGTVARPVLPELPPYRDDILLLHGSIIEFTDEAGQPRIGRVSNKYTVVDRAAGRQIAVRTGADTATVSEDSITRIVELSGWSADYARTPQEARAAAVASRRFRAYWDEAFVLPGERVVDAADFSAAAGYSAEDRRAIAALQVGQTWESPDYGRAHYVTRLPDHGPSLDPARMQVIWNDFVSLDGGDPAQWNATAARPASNTQARGTDDDLQP